MRRGTEKCVAQSVTKETMARGDTAGNPENKNKYNNTDICVKYQ